MYIINAMNLILKRTLNKFKKPNIKQKQTFILISLYLLSVSIRLFDIKNASIYSDEITWMVRGKELIYAIIHGNANFFINAWWNKTSDTEAIAIPLTFLNGIFQFVFAGNGKYSLKIFSDILASRIPIVLTESLIPITIYYFGSNLFSKRLALFSAIVYIFNPISIAFSRSTINDSLLTLFSFVSLISYIYFLKKQKINIIPGISLALAFLTKPNGLLVILGWLVYSLLSYKKSKISIKFFIINLFTSIATITALWPSSWQKPVYAIIEYIYRQFTLTQTGMTVFYKGLSTKQPGLDFYFLQYLIRTPEILIFGFVISLFFLINKISRKTRLNNQELISIIIYNLVFFIIISISNKKLGIRYALPLLPWFIIASVWGLIKLIEAIKNKYLKATIITITTANILYPLLFNPDYYFYYNFLAGGPKGAQNYDMVGFCNSSRLATKYLENINAKGKLFVLGCPEAIPYYLSPDTNLKLTYHYKEADYIILETYITKQHPEDEIVNQLTSKEAFKEIVFHKAVIAKIYKN